MSILQDLTNNVLMPARSVCDDNAIMYYVHASPVYFQHMDINVNLSFRPIWYMQLVQDSSLIFVVQLHIDVLNLCPTCNKSFDSFNFSLHANSPVSVLSTHKSQNK
jgi:hypothetical protein